MTQVAVAVSQHQIENIQSHHGINKKKEKKMPLAISDSAACDDEAILRELVSHYNNYTVPTSRYYFSVFLME